MNRHAFVLVLDRLERVLCDDHDQCRKDGQEIVDGGDARNGADVSRELLKRAFLNHEKSAGQESSSRAATSDTNVPTGRAASLAALYHHARSMTCPLYPTTAFRTRRSRSLDESCARSERGVRVCSIEKNQRETLRRGRCIPSVGVALLELTCCACCYDKMNANSEIAIAQMILTMASIPKSRKRIYTSWSHMTNVARPHAIALHSYLPYMYNSSTYLKCSGHASRFLLSPYGPKRGFCSKDSPSAFACPIGTAREKIRSGYRSSCQLPNSQIQPTGSSPINSLHSRIGPPTYHRFPSVLRSPYS
jgi:hypothetical protein